MKSLNLVHKVLNIKFIPAFSIYIFSNITNVRQDKSFKTFHRVQNYRCRLFRQDFLKHVVSQIVEISAETSRM